ncbi:uncharacterized protein DUF4136 [Pontibacter ummariensis]|uniref:DUF4136 domain-containing protein n=1 Tax=Pontibacter ummariensis TaxID=1610492 RepID=A0A239EUE4_9BACT|nr:DUF4136 domain-containing protein [Pontibacter ummariensis]PRY12756.1 uncharacterized protein DUF4136 [Pontibacter ummariensis]SNS47898.1 protein of unknown function [Pontibacter ummariensis]
MAQPLRLFFSFLVLLVVTGCSPAIHTNTEAVSGFNLNNYQTFGFYEVDASGDALGANYQQPINYLQEEIARQLEARGLTRTTTDPDLLINLGIVVDEQVQTRETSILTDPPNYIGQRRYTWKAREVEVGRYKEGTVSVHLVDKDQNELVWRGTAESILESKPAKLQEQIAQGVQKLFNALPQ